MIGTTDSRLQTITLIGDSSQVSVAENYLRQLDLRQRQVALTVRILDVSLDNATEIDNSFAFRYGSNFIVNDQGRLLAAFGKIFRLRPQVLISLRKPRKLLRPVVLRVGPEVPAPLGIRVREGIRVRARAQRRKQLILPATLIS